jgi:hypothetical protein
VSSRWAGSSLVRVFVSAGKTGKQLDETAIDLDGRPGTGMTGSKQRASEIPCPSRRY